VKAENASEGSVVLDGNPLVYEDVNGWKLKAPDQVELLGEACTQVQAGDDQLDINFPCRIFVPVK
ncbi:MAG TPA: VWA domain-containing protein, partial [Polyangiaceae bacterium]|nr:VWA domain-containing protein [Polyangiaceae bacterium]